MNVFDRVNESIRLGNHPTPEQAMAICQLALDEMPDGPQKVQAQLSQDIAVRERYRSVAELYLRGVK